MRSDSGSYDIAVSLALDAKSSVLTIVDSGLWQRADAFLLRKRD